MVKFPFKDNDGFEVPFPSQGRRIVRGGRRGLNSGGNPIGATEGVVDEGDGSGGSTRAFLPHLSRDQSQESSTNIVGSSTTAGEKVSLTSRSSSRKMNWPSWYSKGGVTSFLRKSEIDLNYDDSDLERIQRNEQTISDAAMQAREAYSFQQKISRLHLTLYVLVALIIGTFNVYSIALSL